MALEIRAARDDELELHGALREQAYGFAPPHGADDARRIRAAGIADRALGAYDGTRLIARLMVLPFGQFFGGRPVPMGGVSGVVAAPDYRGRGVASRLLDAAIVAMHERGEVVSALGPATRWVYRKCGWELAGEEHVRSVSTAALLALPRTELRERPASEADHDAIKRVYLRACASRPGMLARPVFTWAERLAAMPGRYVFVVEQAQAVCGYVIYNERRRREGGYTLSVEDIAAVDWEAELPLWCHLGAHVAQAERALVFGWPLDALSLHLREDSIDVVHPFHWMLRIVDAQGAIGARGFPAAVSLSLGMRISDQHGPWNDGEWALDISAGRGTLTRASGSDGIALTVNALASLYTGFQSARTLAAAGLLRGASSEQLANLDAAFAGPVPAMNDDF